MKITVNCYYITDKNSKYISTAQAIDEATAYTSLPAHITDEHSVSDLVFVVTGTCERITRTTDEIEADKIHDAKVDAAQRVGIRKAQETLTYSGIAKDIGGEDDCLGY